MTKFKSQSNQSSALCDHCQCEMAGRVFGDFVVKKLCMLGEIL